MTEQDQGVERTLYTIPVHLEVDTDLYEYLRTEAQEADITVEEYALDCLRVDQKSFQNIGQGS